MESNELDCINQIYMDDDNCTKTHQSKDHRLFFFFFSRAVLVETGFYKVNKHDLHGFKCLEILIHSYVNRASCNCP